MPLVELRCTRCAAPLETTSAVVLTCRYCGATMMQEIATAQPAGPSKEIFVLVLGRIGPSNRARIAQLVSTCAHVSIDDATKLVASAPCEIPFGNDDGVASDLQKQIIEAGGSAEVESRFIVVPTLPSKTVQLDDAGPRHVAVIKVVREYLDLGIAEAKHLVDSAPCVLTKTMEGGRAKNFHDALVDAGATSRIG